MPLAENVRRPRVQEPDKVKIVTSVEEAFAVSGIGHAAMNIQEARIERPLESPNYPAIALHDYPNWRLDCKFIRRPCDYFRARGVRTGHSDSYLANPLQCAAYVQCAKLTAKC